MAEETGLILPVGEWVLREACKQNKQWQQLGLPNIRVAVNVATKQLKHPEFGIVVREILAETKLSPEFLEIEVTENVILTSKEAASIFSDLKKLGIHLALDDFGSGYMLLNHLKVFPIDRIKIDKSYISNIHYNKVDEVIIQAIITLAHSLDLEIVAEGVESCEQLQFLETHHCTEAQGYYFCKPLASNEFEAFLRKSESV